MMELVNATRKAIDSGAGRGRPGGPRGRRGGRGHAVAVRAVHRRGDVGAAGPPADGRAGRLAGGRPGAAGRGVGDLRRPGRRQGRGTGWRSRRDITEDELRGAGAGRPSRSIARWTAARCARSIVRAPKLVNVVPAHDSAPGLACRRVACRPCRVAVVTDSTAYLPPGARGAARHQGRPGAGRHRRREPSTRATGVSSDAVAAGAAGLAPGHDVAAEPAGLPGGLPGGGGRRRRRRGRVACTCPGRCPGPSRLRAARRRGVTGPGPRRRLAHRSGWRWGSAWCPAPRRRPPAGRVDEVARATGEAVRRAPRRSSTSTRSSTCAAAAGSGRPRRSSGRRSRSSRCCRSSTAGSRRWRRCGRRHARWRGWRSSPSERAGTAPVDIAVHHLAAPARADQLATQLRESVPGLRELVVSEVGAVVGAHVGPGMIAVAVAPF